MKAKTIVLGLLTASLVCAIQSAEQIISKRFASQHVLGAAQQVLTIAAPQIDSFQESAGSVDPPMPFRITEFMASNRRTLNDEDGDSSDWIEIYNPNAFPADLDGWWLTDNLDNLRKWQVPEGVSISGNGYLIVFASGKNRNNASERLHTNFQLGFGGEFLGLVDPEGNIVSQFSPVFPLQYEDVAYGRDSADPEVTGFLLTPTPGAQNPSKGPGFSPEVQFSRASGTFLLSQPFAVELTTPMPGARIYYAYGTNVPGLGSLLYSNAIQVTNTVVIRARAFLPDYFPGPISSALYVALATDTNVARFTSHLPIVVLHTYGSGALPLDQSLRPAVLQAFEPGPGFSSMTNRPSLAERGTVTLRGAATLAYPKSSFNVETQDETGRDKDVPFCGLPAESDWVLHAPNTFDLSLINDPLALQLAADMGQYAPRTRLVELFYKDDAGSPGPITWSDYNGVYVLEEKIKRSVNRVPIEKLEVEHVNASEITGGYMFTLDRAKPGEPQLPVSGTLLNWIEPRGAEMPSLARQPQLLYISNYFSQFNLALMGANWTNPTSGYTSYIDVDSWVTRHIHEVLMLNVDALRLNSYFYKPRGEKIHFGPAWDFDRSQGGGDDRNFYPFTWRPRTGDLGTDYFNFLPWWGRLFQDPDFWQLWIDKYQAFRTGPLASGRITSRIEEFASQVRPAHAREVTRWLMHQPRSGVVTSAGYTHNFGSDGYENEVRWKATWFSNRLHFMDTQFLARPFLSQPNGPVFPGTTMTIVNQATIPGTRLYYTVDGTDPRLPGGTISPSARVSFDVVNVTVTSNVNVFARAWNGAHRNLTGPNNPPVSSPWSGLATGLYYVNIPPLRITEIMYHPEGDGAAEFIEVRNSDSAPLNVRGFRIHGGIDFTFPNVTLSPGEVAVIVADVAAFQARYGSLSAVIGAYLRRLDNLGEWVILEGPVGEPIMSFRYEPGWYPITGGFGFSLVNTNQSQAPSPMERPGIPGSWRPSGLLHGSPGVLEGPAAIPRVVINEILPRPGSAGTPKQLELMNLESAGADISGWYLTDNFYDPKKYRFPAGTVLSGGAYRVVEQSEFSAGDRTVNLGEFGGEVYLFSADAIGNLTGYYDGFDYGTVALGQTFGRHVISTLDPQYPEQGAETLGAVNIGPRVGPVVISEIHYHPLDFLVEGAAFGNSRDEYIELQNISSTNVPLYDPNYPENTWRFSDAVDFTFPCGVVLPAGGRLLVVAFDPTVTSELESFRTRFGLPVDAAVHGPFRGTLSDQRDSVELRRPDVPTPTGPLGTAVIPYILVERVKYSDAPVWPGVADGFGASLHRRVPGAYGNDPTNWVAAAPRPGTAHLDGPLPQITLDLPNYTSAVLGGALALRVEATGGPLEYVWMFNGNVLVGERNDSLTLTDIQHSDRGLYRVGVFNAAGAVISRAAYLDILIPPTITSQPADFEVYPGESVTLSVAATSSASVISYQWLRNGMPIAGATSPTYSINDVKLEDSGVYEARVSDSVASILSRQAKVIVLIVPTIVVQPQSQTVTEGQAVTLSVAITNTATLPIGYRWRRAGTTIVSNWMSSLSDFLMISNVSGVSNYTVVVYNRAQPYGDISSIAVVSAVPDRDGDGMGDAWEDTYDLNADDPADASADPDGDGWTNLTEHRAGTNPRDPQSILRVHHFGVTPPQAVLRFVAASNKTYSVLVRDDLSGAPWRKLTDVPARPENYEVEIIGDGLGTASRYYELVTPRRSP